ncbi:MAG: winged helix-turn-helix transcriptional regulator [Candidatus Asgardarchaeia archaeon]
MMANIGDLEIQLGRMPVKIAAIMSEAKTQIYNAMRVLLKEYTSSQENLYLQEEQIDKCQHFLDSIIEIINKTLDNTTIQIVTLVQSSNSRVIEIFNQLSSYKSVEELFEKLNREIKECKIENERLRGLLIQKSDFFKILSIVEERKSLTKSELLTITGLSNKKISRVLKELEGEGYIKIDKSRRPYRIIFLKSPWRI